MIRGLVDAARAFNRKEWLHLAFDLNEWMTHQLFSPEGEISSISFENKTLSSHAFLDDYAFWAESLLNLSSISDWIEVGSSQKLIQQAEKITHAAILNFKDPHSSGFFFSKDGQDNPAQVRKKFWYDNAIPSANSCLLKVFSNLFQLTKKRKLAKRIHRSTDSLSKSLQKGSSRHWACTWSNYRK